MFFEKTSFFPNRFKRTLISYLVCTINFRCSIHRPSFVLRQSVWFQSRKREVDNSTRNALCRQSIKISCVSSLWSSFLSFVSKKKPCLQWIGVFVSGSNSVISNISKSHQRKSSFHNKKYFFRKLYKIIRFTSIRSCSDKWRLWNLSKAEEIGRQSVYHWKKFILMHSKSVRNWDTTICT